MQLYRTHINAGGGYTSNRESGELYYDCKCKHDACHAAYVMGKREPIGLSLDHSAKIAHVQRTHLQRSPR